MKKLIIFLIPFIVSISAYAQDESLFAGNFSLIKYSETNNRKAFEIDIFSERTHLLGVNAFENRKQNWWDKSNIRYGPQQYLRSEEESESLAFGYLKRFAERNKKRRKTGWYKGLIGGGISLALGAAVISSVKEEDSFQKGFFKYFTGIGLVGGGVGTVVGGILVSVIPSRAERKLKDVLSISDRAQRERASHEALSSLAARGRRSRILGGIFSAALSVGSVAIVVYAHAEESEKKLPLIEYFYAGAAAGAALAVFAFVVKSPGERTFEDYLKERKREQRKELGLRLGITPYGGLKIGFVYSF